MTRAADAAHISARAALLAQLPPHDAERAAAEVHAAACAPCAAALEEGALLATLLDDDALAGPSPQAIARTLDAVHAELPRSAPTERALPAPAAVGAALLAVWGVLLAAGQHHAGGPATWALTTAVAAAAHRTVYAPRHAVARQLLSALALALVFAASLAQWMGAHATLDAAGVAPGADGSLVVAIVLAVTVLAAAAGGVRRARGLIVLLGATSALRLSGATLGAEHAAACVLSELAAAVAPLAVALYVSRRGASVGATPARSPALSDPALPERIALVRAALAGAAAGHAALFITCPESENAAHLLIFHGLGFALAALLGAASATLLPRPAAA